MNEILGYAVEVDDFEKLRAINKRLYDDRALSSDQRRDLANLMFVLLARVEPIRENNRALEG